MRGLSIVSRRRPTRLVVLLGAPLLAVAGLLAWLVSSDLGRQPEPEPDVVPEAVVTVVVRDFGDQFADASVPSHAEINGRVFNLEVANDVASRSVGLGGRATVAEDSGMLFVFPGDGFHRFWMKDTIIPLDLLYIAGDGTIVDIKRMEPEPGVPDGDLTLYEPPVAVPLALEINAGLAQRYGIEAGMAVRFE